MFSSSRKVRVFRRHLVAERLEKRELFVIGAFAAAPATGRGTGFDGVIGLDLSGASTASSMSVGCTGSLMADGIHILTAAHCVDSDADYDGDGNTDDGNGTPDSQNIRVVFDTADNVAGQFTIMTSTAVVIDPAYRETGIGLDWAILTLPAIAPIGADRYPLYRGNADLGSIYTMVGYGTTGTEANQQGNGVLRQRGNNRWEDTVLAGTGLRSDFDDGTAANNLIGDLGVAGGDTFEGRGDSGGPGLISVGGILQVAGIVSYGGTNFGEENVDTRVNRFLPQFDSVIDAPIPFIFDMQFQPALRNNGVSDTIELRRNGANIELVVNGLVEQVRAFANTTRIQVIGSDDSDHLIVDESGGRVIPNGGLTFDGDEGPGDNDELTYFGSGVQSVVYRPDAGLDGNGTLTNSGTGSIVFTNLEPIVVAAVASLTVTTPNSGDVVAVDAPAAGMNRISGTSGAVAFESVTFFDVPNVTIDLATNDNPAAGSDVFTMTAPGLVATGLNELTINGGPGRDTFSVIGSSTTRIQVNGGAPQIGDPGVPPGDVLAVDTTAFANSSVPINQPNGTVTASGMQPINYTSIETLIASDRFENNNTLATATFLGSETEITLRNLSIHSATDQDFFRYTAHSTGRLFIRTLFDNDVGDLDLDVRAETGQLLHASTGVADQEEINMPVVMGQDYFIRVYGAGGSIGNYALEIENFAAPTPSLVDLSPASDSGRSHDDNLTRVTTPTVFVHVDLQNFVDPDNDGVLFTPILTPAQFASNNVGAAVEFFLPTGSIGFGTLVAGAENVFSITSPALADGLYGITAAVRINDAFKQFAATAAERNRHTGRGERSAPLLITIDTAAPEAPTLRLDPAATDTGIATNPGSYADRVTRATTPGLVGFAEAGALVRVSADADPISANVLNASDVFGGQTISVPADYNNSPGLLAGVYRHVLTLNLNDPAVGFPVDGQRQLGVTAEDLAGNVSVPAFLDILVDTTPARVTAVNYPNGTSVFATKPQLAPSPATTSLLLTLAGGPAAAAGLSTPAVDVGLATDPRNYQLVGDHSGHILISGVDLMGANPNEVTVRLKFVGALPDDRFTLTVADALSDAAGNLLDGDSQAASPGSTAVVLPSGNGLAGGNFRARFTVDSRPELGVVGQGLVYVDINGNAEWDPTGSDNDATNRDFVFQFGTVTDGHFAGNFAAVGGAASGFDKLGVYGKLGPTYSFLIDTNDDGVGDVASASFYQVNAMPVAGNFSAAHPGDEIGMFDGAFWYLDLNGNNTIDFGEKFPSEFTGIPLVGNFDGLGGDDLATYRNDTNTFYFDLNQNGTLDATWEVRDTVKRFGGLAGFTDRPVAGDLNLDGVDDIGLWTKGNGALLPDNSGEVFFWVSDRQGAVPAALFDSYSPAPLGNDLFMQFGHENALPVFGNFDPPIADLVIPPSTGNYLHRADRPLDVNGDSVISPLDALVVINALNSRWETAVANPVRAAATFGSSKVDTSGDAILSPIDALLVINQLNRNAAGSGEGESQLSTFEASIGHADFSRVQAIDLLLAGNVWLEDIALDEIDLDGFELKRRR